jgi:hypothetical protein
VLPLPPDKRAKGRRIAEAVLGVGTRARARRAAGGAAASGAAASGAAGPAEQPRQVSAEEAAARLDAARERLRSRIPPPAEDDGQA